MRIRSGESITNVHGVIGFFGIGMALFSIKFETLGKVF
jgi:hypothetical protein